MTLETLFKEAGVEAEKIYWQRFFEKAASEPDVEISKKADKRITNYIRECEKMYLPENGKTLNSTPKKRSFKVLFVAAILIVLLSVSAFSFHPVRDFIYNVYNKGTEFFFGYNKHSGDDFLYAEYPSVPGGYELIYNEKSVLGQKIIYAANNNRRIVINTNPVKHSSVFIDTENAKTGEIPVNGFSGYYSITESSIILVWSSGKYYHYISADFNGSLITLETVVSIAESRIPEKK